MSTIPQQEFIRNYRAFTDKERSMSKADRVAMFIRFLDLVRHEDGWVKVVAIAHELDMDKRTARRYSFDLVAAGYARIKKDKDASNAMLIRSTR